MDPPANKEKIGVLPRKPRKKRTKKTPGGQEPSATESNSRTPIDGTSSKSKAKEHSGAGGGRKSRLPRGIGGHGETKSAKTQGSPTVSSSSALTHYLESHDAPLAKSKYNKTASGGSSVSSAMYSGLMTEDMIWLAEAGAAPPAKQSTLETIEGKKLESEEAVPTQEAVPRRRMVRRSSSHNDIELMIAKTESQTPAEVDNNPDISTRSEPPSRGPPSRGPRRTSNEWNHLIALKLKAKEQKQQGLSAEKMKAKELTHMGDRRDRTVLPGDAESNAADAAGTNSAPKTALKVFGDEEEIAESKHRQKKKLMLLLVALVLLLVLIFGIVFGLSGGNSSNNNAVTVDSVEGGPSKGNADGSSKPMAPVFQPSLLATPSPVDGEGVEAVEINQPAGPPSPPEDLKPSNSPVVVYKETVHIVQMLLESVDDQFNLSSPYVNSILRYVTAFVYTHLEQPYVLRSVELQEGIRELIAPQSNIRRRRRLQTFTIPLRITISGPAGLHMKSILELFLDTTDIRNYLKTLNAYAFREVTVSFQLDFLDEQDKATVSPVDPVALAPPDVPPAEPLLAPPTPSPLTGNPMPTSTNRPTPKPSYKTFPTCPPDLLVCDNGASVFRNPLNDCQFFPCPGNSKPVVDTSASTPSPPTVGSTLATDPPVTTLPTPSPTRSLSPSVRITTQSPVSEVPTEVPTLKPTSTTSVACTSLSNGQCNAPLSIGSKCYSSDTQKDDNYGHAVALTTRSNGQVLAVVGSRYHDVAGSAYLLSYDRTSNEWKHVAEFVPGGASANGGFNPDSSSSYDQFGFAVAISEDWVAIASPNHVASKGQVSMYNLRRLFQGGQVQPDVELTADDGIYRARFGSAVSLSDNGVLVVGASNDRSNLGSAYVYKYESSSWRQVAKLAPEDVSSDSQGNFGRSVALVETTDGVTVAVGAPFDSTRGRRRNGSVYIYAESPSGFTQTEKLEPFDLLAGDQFGYSVDLAVSTNQLTNAIQTTCVVGTKLDDDKGQESGSASVFLRRGGNNNLFTSDGKLTAPDWSPGAQFGISVALAGNGNLVLVGSKSRNNVGGAHLFEKSGASWQLLGTVAPPDGKTGDDFGSAVALTTWPTNGEADVGVALIGSFLSGGAGATYSYSVCR